VRLEESVHFRRLIPTRVQQRVADGDAVRADRFVAEAEAVADRTIDGHIALGGEGLPEKELLLLEGVLRADHGEADARRASDDDLVPRLKGFDQGLE
jgi:hypothetical protein